MIKEIYKNPQFQVEVEGDQSQWKRQETGIRQGCPLSPYLFILVITTMFADVHDQVNRKLFTATPRKGAIDGLDYTEVLYADGTLLVVQDDKTIT